MHKEEVLKKYTGIKWGLVLLTGTGLVFLIKGNLLMLVINTIAVLYFFKLKKEYQLLLTEE